MSSSHDVARRRAPALRPGAAFWRLWAVAALLAMPILWAFALSGHAAPMRASFYGAESGTRTASGAHFDWRLFTAAHRSWPFGTRFRVCYRRCAIGIVNDRGPAAWTGRAIDLSRGLARAIGLEPVGVAIVDVDRLN